MKLMIKSPIRHDGVSYKKGQTIDITDEKAVQRLYNLGVVSFVTENPFEKADDYQIGKVDDYQSLDEAYKADELKQQAIELGIEFDKNISKKDLINLIIEQGKVAEFFDEEEE